MIIGRKLNIGLFSIWIALILLAVLLPANSLDDNLGFFSFIPYFDKLVHLIMFGVFAFLFFWLVYKNVNKSKSFIITITISIGFGIITELLQLALNDIIGRSFDIMDILFDFIGILLSLMFCLIILSFNQNKQ